MCRQEQRPEYIAAWVRSNPIAEGGMRFTFPPYGKKIEGMFKKNYIKKSSATNSLLYMRSLD
jgi:hypothetical protein